MIDFAVTLESDHIMLRPMAIQGIVGFKTLSRDESMWAYFTSDLSIHHPQRLASKWIY